MHDAVNFRRIITIWHDLEGVFLDFLSMHRHATEQRLRETFAPFGEASCAALLVGASSPQLQAVGWPALCFPLIISVGELVPEGRL